MTPHQTIAVAVRLFAIWLLISFLTGLVSLYAQFRALGYPDRPLLVVLVGVVTLLFVFALWMFPQTLARWLLTTSATEPTPTAPRVPADTWLAMGSALLGLWVLTHSLPAIIRDVVILNSADTATDTSEVHNWLLYNLAQGAIALWLVFGAKGFRRIFWWVQYAGMGNPSNNPSREP